MSNPLKYFFLVLFFFISTLLVYSQTIHSKFVFDFIDLVFDFVKRSWGDLGNSSTGLSPYCVAKFAFYVLLKIFQFNAYGWYFVACLLHALNALLLYVFALRLLKISNHPACKQAAIAASVIFLFSPYHTETIVWGGAFNYLIVGFLILLHINTIFNFLLSGKTSWGVLSVFTFLLAVFTHEWGLFLLPADIIILILLKEKLKVARKGTFVLFSSSFVVVGLYFLNQLVRGQLIGHYGSETHLQFKLSIIVSGIFKYLFKILFLAGFFPPDLQTKIYDALLIPYVFYSLSVLLLLVFSACTYALLKTGSKVRIAAFFFLLFGVFIFPVLNLYFPYWIKIQSDRYCYLPGAFLLTAASCVLFLSRNLFSYVLVSFFAVVSIFFVWQNNVSWRDSAQLQQKLEEEFKWWNAKHVYILNLPDNVRGAYTYRNLRASQFAGNFVKYNFCIPENNITEVLSYNLNKITDSVFVEKAGEHQLKVTLSEPNIWWWWHTMGATDYEDELLKVDVDDYNHSYIVNFKQKKEDDVFLYQANGHWRQVKFFD